MNRRTFLTAAAAGASFAGLPYSAAAADDDIAAAFAAARKTNPRLAAFDNAPGEFDFESLRLEGGVPDGLTGVFYRNGPAQHERNGERYRHWFDGDGLVHRWSIGPQGVGYRGRFVDTPKRRAEKAAGRFLFPAGGGGIPARAAMNGPDAINVANTNVLPIQGELWALWEGGSATRMDPKSLATKEVVTLRDDLRGAPFSAHPRIGQDGRVWNIGIMGDKLAIYRLSATGVLEAVKLHAVAPAGLAHDFLLTEKSVVVVLPSTRIGAITDGFFGAIKGRPDVPMTVKVFDRETLALVREAELPAGYVFHFGNAWEERDGTIRFDMVFGDKTDEIQELRKPMRGEMPAIASRAVLVTLPAKGAPRSAPLRAAVEFPRVSPRMNTRRHRFTYLAAQATLGQSAWFDAVAKIDLERGRNSFAAYGPDWMVEEHVFVPRASARSEDDGWLIGTALNWKAQKTALSVFDARRPDAGPLMRAWLDVAMPLGFHGQFAAA
jgi:all-trans-8'-apo-beta-carotenal 15,15'-oxygenase